MQMYSLVWVFQDAWVRMRSWAVSSLKRVCIQVGIWCGFTYLAPAERSSIKAMQVKSTTSMLLEARLSGSHVDEAAGTGSQAAMRATFIAQGGAEGGGSGGH